MPDVLVACPDCGEMVPAPVLGDHVCDPGTLEAFDLADAAIRGIQTILPDFDMNGDHVTDAAPPIPPAPTEPVVDHAQQVQVGGVIGYVAQLLDRMATDPQGPNVPTPWPEGPDTAHLDFAAVAVLVLADVLELPADALQTISTGLLSETEQAPPPGESPVKEAGAGGEPPNSEQETTDNAQ